MCVCACVCACVHVCVYINVVCLIITKYLYMCYNQEHICRLFAFMPVVALSQQLINCMYTLLHLYICKFLYWTVCILKYIVATVTNVSLQFSMLIYNI